MALYSIVAAAMHAYCRAKDGGTTTKEAEYVQHLVNSLSQQLDARISSDAKAKGTNSSSTTIALQDVYSELMPPMLKQLLHCNCNIHPAKFCSDYLLDYEVLEPAKGAGIGHQLRRRKQQQRELGEVEAEGAEGAEVCAHWCKGCCAKANICPLKHCLWVPDVMLEFWEARGKKLK